MIPGLGHAACRVLTGVHEDLPDEAGGRLRLTVDIENVDMTMRQITYRRRYAPRQAETFQNGDAHLSVCVSLLDGQDEIGKRS